MRFSAGSVMLGMMAILFFSSCNKHYKQFTRTFGGGKEDNAQNFVVTREGKKVESEEVKEKAPLFSKSVLKLDDGSKIPVRNVVAYQNNEGYYARLNDKGGLLKRVHKGKIDYYEKIVTTYEQPQYRSFNGSQGISSPGRTRSSTYYYLKKGVNGDPVLLKPSNGSRIYDLVADYAPSAELMDKFVSKRRQLRVISYVNWAAFTGGFVLAVTTKGSNPGRENLAGGLMLGGMLSGIVNLTRKAKNNNRMLDALTEYNLQQKIK